MRNSTLILAAGLALGSGLPAAAQDSPVDAEQARREAEIQRELEQMRAEEARREAEIQREVVRETSRAARDAERVRVDVEVEMRDAESRLAEAARRVAELSSRRLPNMGSGAWTAEIAGKAVLGISIGTRNDAEGPVEGVEVMSVSPGGAAAEAGLRAGDVITGINGDAMSADSADAAGRKLLDFMSGVEEGDKLDVEYLRDGKSAKTVVEPRTMARVFSFNGGNFDVQVPHPLRAPAAPSAFNRYVFISQEGGFGDLEMVKLTEGLGRYFGTDTGLLVVRAPENEDTYKLQDGDVILDIDGREPSSVSHAVRILGSYQEGETLEIRIMRDKRRRTVEVEMPDNRSGGVIQPVPPIAQQETITIVPAVGGADVQ